MTYLRFSPEFPRQEANDNWSDGSYDGMAPERGDRSRRAPPPARFRRRASHTLASLLALLIGACGVWLLLGIPTPTALPAPPTLSALIARFPDGLAGGPPAARPLVFPVEPPAPGLTIVVSREPPPSNHPETWGALPTASAGPVVAIPLADTSPAPEDLASCRGAPSLAAQMTCIDPVLREADRRMAAAYDAVLATGVTPAALGRSQARWLAVRDAAAGASPEDLLAAYQQRESRLRGFAAAFTRRAASVGLRQAPSAG
jgi:uncharacterized protein YecT (DUF1311 family)